MQTATRAFEWSVGASQALFGRRIKHIVLMHIGAMDADMIDRFLTERLYLAAGPAELDRLLSLI